MRHAILASLCILILISAVKANTGYFAGSGQTIKLTKTETIQLVSEDVTITPMCGWTMETDSVDFHCMFVLRNLAPEAMKVQIGFPLDMFTRQTKEQPKATGLVLRYHFIVRDEEDTYHVRYVSSDSEKKFSHLFVWDVAFKPKETKLLHVSYQMPMSLGLTSTRKPESFKDGYPHHEKRWQAYLEMTVIEHFHYVTETGTSWAGPIEKATFRVATAGLARCMDRRPVLDREPPIPASNEPDWSEPYTIPVRSGPVYQSISPEGGKHDARDGTTTWEYRDYKPGAPLDFLYYVVAMPKTADDCESWVRHIAGNTVTKADLMQMREIVAAFYGIAPRSASAKNFVEQQVWYHPKKDFKEAALTADQKAVLARLDAMVRDAK